MVHKRRNLLLCYLCLLLYFGKNEIVSLLFHFVCYDVISLQDSASLLLFKGNGYIAFVAYQSKEEHFPLYAVLKKKNVFGCILVGSGFFYFLYFFMFSKWICLQCKNYAIRCASMMHFYDHNSGTMSLKLLLTVKYGEADI